MCVIRLWFVFPLHGHDTCSQVEAVKVGGPIRARSAAITFKHCACLK